MKRILQRAGQHLKDHVIPHERNNYHPHLLRHRVLLGYSAALILLKAVVISLSVALPSSSVLSSSITPQNIVDLTNQTRRDLGLPALTVNSRLAQAAAAKGQDMVAHAYFAHTSPAGLAPWYWIKQTGYTYLYSGENLAVHYTAAEDVESGWIASPTHRANIVNPRYTEIGVGVSYGDFEGAPSIFVVEMFGHPASPAAEVVPTSTALAVASTTSTEVTAPPVVIRRVRTGYRVQTKVEGATTVSAQLGTHTVALSKTPETNEWSGDVPSEDQTMDQSGEQIYLLAELQNGEVERMPVALVAPNADTQMVYDFQGRPDAIATFFGTLHVHELQDSARKTYLLFMLLLGVVLLFSLAVKVYARHLPMVLHAVFVIGLAAVLAFI